MSYEGLIETILAADNRIKSVILDDPELNTNLMDSNNSTYPIVYSDKNDRTITTKINKFKVELLAKSILAGVTPWCTFDNTV